MLLITGGYFFPSYWEHRYDELISRQARVYRLDEKLVWSLIYEETWFRAWKLGAAALVMGGLVLNVGWPRWRARLARAS